MKNYIAFLFFTITFSSCSVNIHGLTSDYGKSKAISPDLFVKVGDSTSLCNLSGINDRHVYITNGIQLKECIKKNRQAIVFIWGPRCESKMCYSLDLLQEKCNEKNIDLFIVAEYYDNELMEKAYYIKRPIFAIDTEYYKTNLTSKYREKFIYDLISQEDEDQRLIYFENGVFMHNINNIDSI